jgi:hypothetical protein
VRRILERTAFLATVSAVACGESRFMRVGLEPSSSNGIPAFQQVGDSVRLHATEWTHRLIGDAEPASPSSLDAPDRYVWSSSNSAVAEIRPSGWMINRSAGQVIITVTGAGSSYAQAVSVCARETQLRIDPRDPVIRLHDTMTVSVSLIQPNGAECGRIDFGAFMPQQGSGTAGLEPIFSHPNRWRAIRPGMYWYTSSFSFAQQMLRDSILVTVERKAPGS